MKPYREILEQENKKLGSLQKRIEKLSVRGGKLAQTKWKLIDEVEKIQKLMEKAGIEEIPYGPGLVLTLDEDAMDTVRNWMS